METDEKRESPACIPSTRESRSMSEAEEGSNEFHEQLKNLIEGTPMNWICAILWQLSPQQLMWKFQSGYYRGTRKTKEVTHAESERFFKISQSQSFPFGEDLPGSTLLSLRPVWVNTAESNALTWRLARTKWSHQFGIQTFLCIPMWKGTKNMVLELASTQIIPYYPQCLQQMVDFIHPIGTPHLLIDPLNRKDLWNRKILHDRANNEMQTPENNSSSKPFRGIEKINDSKCSRSILTETYDRGKEKISDSKCSWSILTESSGRDTDGTFSTDCSGPS